MTWARSNESDCNIGLFHADSVKAYIYMYVCMYIKLKNQNMLL